MASAGKAGLLSALVLWMTACPTPAPSAKSVPPPPLPGLRIDVEADGVRYHVHGLTADGTLELDDDPGFARPLRRFELDGPTGLLSTEGLSPGTRYFVRALPARLTAEFAVPGPAGDGALGFDYLQRAWARAGRPWLASNAGLIHDDDAGWTIDPDWPNAPDNAGPRAYYVGHAAVVGVHLATMCGDAMLIDELAGFYLAYLERFEDSGTLATWDRSPLDANRFADTSSYVTLPWVETTARGQRRLRECELCNLQGLYPAARLLRTIASLPDSERSATARRFADQWAPVLIADHVLRHEVMLAELRAGMAVPESTFDGARELARAVGLPSRSLGHALLDRHLWLMATAAELLGAHAAAPALTPMSSTQHDRLAAIVADGAALLQRKATAHAAAGAPNGGLSFFEGDFADRSDYRFAGHELARPPDAAEPAVVATVGWDVSHYHRLPIVLRALYENRDATAVPYPELRDLRRAADHYATTINVGDAARPRLTNFSDGSDGWFRVGYHGPSFGYPPSEACDSRQRQTPCLMAGGVQGWGMLGFASPALGRTLDALVRLSAATAPERIEHRDRLLTFAGQSFARTDAQGEEQYPPLLLFVAGTAPERIAGCVRP